VRGDAVTACGGRGSRVNRCENGLLAVFLLVCDMPAPASSRRNALLLLPLLLSCCCLLILERRETVNGRNALAEVRPRLCRCTVPYN